MQVRKLMLDTTLGYLESLKRKAGETDDIQKEIAFIHTRLGSYFGSIRGSNLGEFDKALEHYTLAQSMYNELAQNGDVKNKYNVALLHNSMFDIHWANKEFIKCLSSLDKADSAVDIFILEFPDSPRGGRLKESIAMSRIDTYLELEDASKVNELLQASIDNRRKRLRADAKNEKFRRDLANILQRAGFTQAQMNEFELAIETYSESRDIFVGLVEDAPENGRAPRDLAWAEYFLAEAIVAKGAVSAGLDRFEVGLVLLQNRCVANPEDDDSRKDVLTMVELYANRCKETANLDRSDAFIRALLATIQPVIEANPSNYALADMFNKVQKYLVNADNVAIVE